jgi:CBS-domain-containing membrane protein
MANKQTAMQELIHWLKIGWKDEDIDTVIKKAEQLLEMEKEQIEEAFNNSSYFIDGKEYYHDTYGN